MRDHSCHTVGKALSLAVWPIFTPRRILATNHCCSLSEDTSSRMENQQRWLLVLQESREGDKDMVVTGTWFC